MNINKELKN